MQVRQIDLKLEEVRLSRHTRNGPQAEAKLEEDHQRLMQVHACTRACPMHMYTRFHTYACTHAHTSCMCMYAYHVYAQLKRLLIALASDAESSVIAHTRYTHAKFQPRHVVGCPPIGRFNEVHACMYTCACMCVHVPLTTDY